MAAPFACPRSPLSSHWSLLNESSTTPRVGGRDGYRYSVLFDGKLLVENSRDPECDAARALLAQGIRQAHHVRRQDGTPPDHH